MPENITQKSHVTPTSTQMDTIESSLTAVALKERGYTAKDLLQHYQTHRTGHEQLSPHFMLWLAGYITPVFQAEDCIIHLDSTY